jgi:hypothetical protein
MNSRPLESHLVRIDVNLNLVGCSKNQTDYGMQRIVAAYKFIRFNNSTAAHGFPADFLVSKLRQGQSFRSNISNFVVSVSDRITLHVTPASLFAVLSPQSSSKVLSPQCLLEIFCTVPDSPTHNFGTLQHSRYLHRLQNPSKGFVDVVFLLLMLPSPITRSQKRIVFLCKPKCVKH